MDPDDSDRPVEATGRGAQQPVGAPALPGVPPPRTSDSAGDLAVAALVTGIVGLVLFFPFGPIVGPVAIVLAIRALRRLAPHERGRRVAAIAGLVLGSLALAIGVIVFVAAATCNCM